MSADPQSLRRAFYHLAVSVFPFLESHFPRRFTGRARVVSSYSGTATVQPLKKTGEDDTSQPVLSEIPLPAYLASLGVGSIVRIAYDWWDAGFPYVQDVVTAVTPHWQMNTAGSELVTWGNRVNMTAATSTEVDCPDIKLGGSGAAALPVLYAGLIEAITAAATAMGDGGAAFKANLLIELAKVPPVECLEPRKTTKVKAE